MKTLPLQNPQPDFDEFTRILKGEILPDRVPLIELFQDYSITKAIATEYLDCAWVDLDGTRDAERQYWKNLVEVQYRLGYDFAKVSGGLDFQRKHRQAVDVHGNVRSWAEEHIGCISSWEDFEKYPWPDLDRVDTWLYEYVSENLPEGMGMLVCSTSSTLAA